MAEMDYDKFAKALVKALKGGGSADFSGGFDFDSEGAGKTAEETAKISKEMKYILDIQKDISQNSEEYFEYLKKIKRANKEIARLKKAEEKQAEKVSQLTLEASLATGDRKAELEAIIEEEKQVLLYLQQQGKAQEKNLALMSKAVKESRSFKLAVKSTVADFKKVGQGFKKVYNFLGIDQVLAMTKSIRTSALEMGILSQQADSFSTNIQAAALDTVQYGVDIEKIAQLQSNYSDELGRTVILSKSAAKGLASMSVVTGLGVEGTSRMAGEMESVGYSAERTAKFTEQTMSDARSMGLNSAKVIKNISQNLKLLNRYNFKAGAKGLAKMAESTTKMGVDMNIAGAMADKLMDIEGAVEMSAQLQVLGGQWSQLADPFKLMYMARNDMQGLTDAVINATKATATFNAKTGEFDISALEMSRLRKVAEATGMNFEELAKSAKQAAKFSAIRKQISYGFDKDTKQFIESTAVLDEKGRAKIMVGTEEKYLNALTETDRNKLKQIAAEKLNMEKMALQSRGLDDMLKDTMTMFRQLLIPLVETINKRLAPRLKEFTDKLKDPKFIEGIWAFAKGIGSFVAGVGEFVLKWPKLTAGLLLGIAGAKWFIHGMTLGLGFNRVARVGTGMGKGGGGMSGYMGRVGSRITPGSVGVGLAGMGVNMLTDATTTPGSGMNIAGKAAGSALEFGSLGFMVGGPWGAAIGGILGGLYGGISAAMSDGEKELKESKSENKFGANDAVVFNPKDKFMKVNDSTMIAGTNINGNKDLARAIMSSTAPGLENKDYLMKSPDNNANRNVISKAHVGFDDLNVGGTINLKLNNEEATRIIGKDLMDDPIFLRTLSLKVNQATARAMNGKV